MGESMHVDTTIGHLSLPPLARGWPVLGNALPMRQDLIAFLVEQYRQLGPIFRVRALHQEFVVLAGPQANLFVTHQGAELFRSHELWYDYGCEFGAPHHLSAIDGELHAQLRKLFKPAYSVGRLLSDIPLLVDVARNVINDVPLGQEVAALSLFRKIVTEQLGRALTNHAPGPELPYIITTIRMALNVYLTKQLPAFMLTLPSYRKAKARYLSMGQEIVRAHRSTVRDKEDLVDEILATSQNPDLQKVLGREEQVIFAALGPFVAGLDTAANECSFMLYELLKHPELLAECVTEADQLFAHGLPTQEQIRRQGVLHHAMMETLRLHSIAPVLNRTASRDFAFAGHRVKEGQQVIIATTVSHFLPELFPDPSSFDIERYNQERKEHKQRGAYAPFGVGTHLCLGAGAAEAQIVLVIATLLHLVGVEQVHQGTRLRVKQDPTPTFGTAFRVSFSQRRQ